MSLLQLIYPVKRGFFTLLGALVVIYLLVIFLSYSSQDPSWSYVSSDMQNVSNIGGAVGAWVADFLKQFLGYGAYLLIVFIVYEVVLLWWQRTTTTLGVFRIFGYIFLVFFGCSLLSMQSTIGHDVVNKFGLLQIPLTVAEEMTTSGGIIGYEIAIKLQLSLTRLWTWLFLLLFFFAVTAVTFNLKGISLFQKYVLSKLIHKLPNRGLITVKKMGSATAKNAELAEDECVEQVHQQKINDIAEIQTKRGSFLKKFTNTINKKKNKLTLVDGEDDSNKKQQLELNFEAPPSMSVASLRVSDINVDNTFTFVDRMASSDVENMESYLLHDFLTTTGISAEVDKINDDIAKKEANYQEYVVQKADKPVAREANAVKTDLDMVKQHDDHERDNLEQNLQLKQILETQHDMVSDLEESHETVIQSAIQSAIKSKIQEHEHLMVSLAEEQRTISTEAIDTKREESRKPTYRSKTKRDLDKELTDIQAQIAQQNDNRENPAVLTDTASEKTEKKPIKVKAKPRPTKDVVKSIDDYADNLHTMFSDDSAFNGSTVETDDAHDATSNDDIHDIAHPNSSDIPNAEKIEIDDVMLDDVRLDDSDLNTLSVDAYALNDEQSVTTTKDIQVGDSDDNDNYTISAADNQIFNDMVETLSDDINHVKNKSGKKPLIIEGDYQTKYSQNCTDNSTIGKQTSHSFNTVHGLDTLDENELTEYELLEKKLAEIRLAEAQLAEHRLQQKMEEVRLAESQLARKLEDSGYTSSDLDIDVSFNSAGFDNADAHNAIQGFDNHTFDEDLDTHGFADDVMSEFPPMHGVVETELTAKQKKLLEKFQPTTSPSIKSQLNKSPSKKLQITERDIESRNESRTQKNDDYAVYDRASSLADISDDEAYRGKSRAFQTAKHRGTLTPIPALSLLDQPDPNRVPSYTHAELEELSELLEIKLQDFNIKSQVVRAIPGPVVTRFEVELAPGVKASKVVGISRDLARSLSMASLRVVEVIPGKPYIGIEVPNRKREMVRLIELLETEKYRDPNGQISMAMGKDIGGKPIITDLAKAPHMLVAGTTGSGKSVLVNSMLLSILLKYTPDELRLILIDPKQLELANYNDIPHLLTPVVTDMTEAAGSLSWCVAEMERRYQLMSLLRVRKLKEFNKKVVEAEAMGNPIIDPLWRPNDSVSIKKAPKLKPLPMIVIVADEFADMIMQVGKQAEELITRLAQKSRAAGIHLMLATQRPSVDVITGLIKANVPVRAALRVNSKVDSRTILDTGGAEDMLGNGDMLFLGPGQIEADRVHGAFVSDEEVNRVCEAWRERGAPEYIDDFTGNFQLSSQDSGGGGRTTGESDALYDEVVAFILETRKVSASSIQRKFSIGYNRAARIVDSMEQAGLISKMDKSGKRELLV